MSLEQVLQSLPTYVLALFRVAGIMLAAPLFGSARIPRRVKLMFAMVATVGMLPAIGEAARLPDSAWELSLGIAMEMIFGLAIGLGLSMVFVAVSWAGDIIGQQMGLGIGAAFDPQFGSSSSVVGDLYFVLALVIFLLANGHHALLKGLAATFQSLPLLAATLDRDLLDLVVGLLQGASVLALKLAAPMLVTMFVVDVVLGFLSKTVPQINVMSAGLSLRSLAGIAVLVLGVALTSRVIRDEMLEAVWQIGKHLEKAV